MVDAIFGCICEYCFFDLFLFWGASLAAYSSLSLTWFCLPIWKKMKWVKAWPPFRPKMGLEYFNIVPKSRPNYHLWWNESKLDRKYFCILILWISDPPQRSNWIRDYQKLQIFRTKVEDKIPRWFFSADENGIFQIPRFSNKSENEISNWIL